MTSWYASGRSAAPFNDKDQLACHAVLIECFSSNSILYRFVFTSSYRWAHVLFRLFVFLCVLWCVLVLFLRPVSWVCNVANLSIFFYFPVSVLWEEFEDTTEVIRIRISKKNRQHKGQKKKYKMTNNDPQNIHIKPKIE